MAGLGDTEQTILCGERGGNADKTKAPMEILSRFCNTIDDMPVSPNNYDHRGGGNYGIVVRCPNIVAHDRLVYFDHNRDRGSWVIRDLITGE